MEYKKGDIILIHGNGFFDKIIQFGQRLRFPASDAYYNHAAIIVSDTGDIVEALAKGVKKTHITKYASSQITCISLSLSQEDRNEIAAYALSCLSEGYGFISFISTAICLLFGLRFVFGFSGEDICSTLAAKALEHGGIILRRDALHMTPADLAMLVTK